MKEIRYQKLVRDNIPDIIMHSGGSAETRILSHEEYLSKLGEKLLEETREYLESESMEEMADILEVVHAIIAVRQWSMEQVECVRLQKKGDNGGFDKRICLLSVSRQD